MESPSAYFKIGLFVLVSFFLGVSTIVVLGAGAMFQESVLWETYIDESVQGLDVGAPVKFRGVKIGRVEEINFVRSTYNTERPYVLITCSFYPDSLGRSSEPDDDGAELRRAIEKGLRVRMASAGLTGGTYLEVDYLDPKRHPPLEIEWSPGKSYIPSIASTATRLTDSAEKILDDVEKARIDQIGVKITEVLDRISSFIEKDLSPAIGSITKSSDQLTTTIQNLDRAIAEDIKKDLEGLVQTVNRLAEEDLTPAVRNIRDATEGLPQTVQRLDRTIRKVERLVVGQEANLDVTLEHLRVVLDDLRSITGRARKYSSQLLFGPPPPPTRKGSK